MPGFFLLALHRGQTALAAAFAGKDAETLRATAVEAVPGRGVQGVVEGRRWRLGRADFAAAGQDDGTAYVAQALVPLSPGLENFLATPEAAGVRNGYARPAQLGADRWAALVGAWNQERRPCLVVNAGTALTIDVLLEDPERPGHGYFAGGCILPGFDLMRGALNRHTAQLPLAEGDFAERE